MVPVSNVLEIKRHKDSGWNPVESKEKMAAHGNEQTGFQTRSREGIRDVFHDDRGIITQPWEDRTATSHPTEQKTHGDN